MADRDRDNTGEAIVQRYGAMKARRGPYEQQWRDILDLVRVNASDVSGSRSVGSRRNNQIYDSTAPNALGEFASGIHAFLSNPTERWFNIEVEGMDTQGMEPDELLWLEQVADRIYQEFGHDQSTLNAALHEAYLDLGAFGTSIVLQDWDDQIDHLRFTTHSIGDCYIEENSRNRVDTLFRKIPWTTRQLVKEFGIENLPPKIRESYERQKDGDRDWECVHAVFPRSDRDLSKWTDTNMPFASVWVIVDTFSTVRESGYLSFPYHVPRWLKLTNETYGRSPAMQALPDVKMLNRMEATLIRASQKIVDPPLVLPNDGFLLPIKTHPGALIFKEPNTEMIETLQMEGNIPIGFEHAQQKRESIKQAFFNDELKLEKNNVEMTALEVAERRDIKLRLLAPMLARQQSELLGPLLRRSYLILSKRGEFPPAPISLSSKTLKVAYSSQAARAQLGTKATLMSQYIQEMVPLAQIQPNVLDAVDMDAYAQELALIRGVPRRILRGPQDLANMRQKREEAEQMAQAAAVAEPASKALKNVADARKAGLNVI